MLQSEQMSYEEKTPTGPLAGLRTTHGTDGPQPGETVTVESAAEPNDDAQPAHQEEVEIKDILERSLPLYRRWSSAFDEPRVLSLEKRWGEVAGIEGEAFRKRFDWESSSVESLGAESTPKPTSGGGESSDLGRWTELLKKVFAESRRAAAGENTPERWPDGDKIPYEEVLSPFVKVGEQARVETSPSSKCRFLTARAKGDLRRGLLRALLPVFMPTLQLEFQIHRSLAAAWGRDDPPASSDNGGGASPRPSSRLYRSFVSRLLEGGLLSLFSKYPVLARLSATTVDYWAIASSELLTRFENDADEILEVFFDGKDQGRVESITTGLSDPHKCGRTVHILTFESGRRLVYKPRRLAPEAGFNRLLAALNETGVAPDLKLFTVLERDGYGWVEYVEQLPCTNEAEICRYYQRAGTLLCVLLALQGSDCHYENVIACGEYPVIIDLETLLTPYVVNPEGDAEKGEGEEQDVQRRSVLRTNLLPTLDEGGRWDADTSGFGGREKQKTETHTWTVKNVNTDDMELIREPAETGKRSNQPMLGDMEVSFEDYVDPLLEGFSSMYRYLMGPGSRLLKKAILEELQDEDYRFIYRATQAYFSLQNEALKPAFLRDGLDRSARLDRLAKGSLHLQDYPRLWPLIREEHEALERLDIPYFHVKGREKGIRLPRHGNVSECFERSGLDAVFATIDSLSEEDLEIQAGTLKGAVLARASSVKKDEGSGHGKYTRLSHQGTSQRFIEVATDIGRRLERVGIKTADGGMTWISPRVRPGRPDGLYPLGPALYDGAMGVALFCAALTKVTGITRYAQVARAALEPVLRRPHGSVDDCVEIGGATGLGSIVYGLVRMAGFLDDGQLLDLAGEYAAKISSQRIMADDKFDLMFGSAGAALGLLALHAETGDELCLRRATECGHHLVAHMTGDLGQRSWKTVEEKRLTGFAHGSAGISYALEKLYLRTGVEDFRQAACEPRAYESEAFLSSINNWLQTPDAGRSEKDLKQLFCSWCHGATGIGLARLGALEVADSTAVRTDLEAAIEATKETAEGTTDQLCCGGLGRAEFLLCASRSLGDSGVESAAYDLAAAIVEQAIDRGSFRCNWDRVPFHWGFFQGSVGIGYELLRLAAPEEVPSVLVLE